MRNLTRREALGLLATGAAGVAGACFSQRPDGSTGPEDEVEVEMTATLRFEPPTVEIESGQTVLWRNTSSFPHTATGDASLANDPSNVQLPQGAASWHSGSVPGGGTYRRRFDVPGTYRYFCEPHEAQDMVGTIIVS